MSISTYPYHGDRLVDSNLGRWQLDHIPFFSHNLCCFVFLSVRYIVENMDKGFVLESKQNYFVVTVVLYGARGFKYFSSEILY